MSDWEKVATTFTSDTEKESYNWLGACPRCANGLISAHSAACVDSITLTNKDWEATLEIDRNAIKDNKLGHIPIRVRA